MKISVYITSYNKYQYLSQAIDSVLNQTMPASELLIIDDYSSDNSREIIREYTSRYPEIIKPIFNEQNYGISRTRNIALSYCQNDIITFLDGDDYFFPSKLKSESEVIKNGNLGCVYSNHVFVNKFGDEKGYFADKEDKPAVGDIFIENFIRSFHVTSFSSFHNEMFYKNSAINIGMYDESIKIWEDWDFRIRMSKKYQYGYCPKVNSAYREYANGLHNSGLKLHFREQIKIYNKNKLLILDLKEEEQSLIINRVYAKIKYLFIQIIAKSRWDKKNILCYL